MQVIYWQILVAGSTLFAYLFFSRKAALLVALFWTGWTFFMLYYLPLIIIQLISAWGTFVLVDRWRSQGVEIKKLRATIADLPNDIQERIEGVVAQDDIKPLSDRQHYDYMLQQIQEAESSILILSGWMSSSVVDKAFIKTLEKALRRGVSVYLGYGYEDSFGNHNASHYSEAALNALKELKSKKGLAPLIVGRFNNHQKLLIRDKKRVVCGSHNWLSNRRFVNHEKSFIVDNERLAIQLFREVSEPIYKNSIL